eukprot:CAMPEP_0173446378 /NCGR_PEP_ID=MMETSP1357-20121228/36456_1 /TAXON_ID=77926 /ORGANISM="Hemiselmis rufescens, Strain PCC563" /LENGTH=45 /DNA_ID= /DNA_START= /DNA_END= /DNA_ORIENTATION=
MKCDADQRESRSEHGRGARRRLLELLGGHTIGEGSLDAAVAEHSG